MRVVLVGGGKVGSYLARNLLAAGHHVTVIEESDDQAEALSDTSKVLVMKGDGTDVGLLATADTHRADWLLAVTGLDEVNLVACQLGLTLGADRVLARLNNPLNRPAFDALDVPVVAVTDLMANLISREVEPSDFRQIALLGRGRISVYEIDIPPSFATCTVAEAGLPSGSLLVTVVSGDDVVVPISTTPLRPGDRVAVVSGVGLEEKVRRALGYPKRKHR